jgi:ech hydrogenase subunit F
MKLFTMTKTVTKNLVKGPATLMYPKRERVFTRITRGQVENDINKCIFCAICSKRCPTYAIIVTKISKENKEWEIDRLKCCTCNVCVEVCPKKCLSMDNHYFPPVTEKTMGIHKQSITGSGALPGKDESHPPERQGQEKKGKTTAKRVVIEKSECTACGACVEACPQVFALEDGAEAATVIQPIGGPEDSIQEAIDSCPTSCIQWED